MNERLYKRDSNATAVVTPARWREYLAIVLVVVAILLTLSLATYDPSYYNGYPLKQCRNLIGPVGALISYHLIRTFGVSVYISPLLLLVLAVFTFLRTKFPAGSSVAWRSGALVGLIVTISCLCDIVLPDNIAGAERAGGIISVWVNGEVLIACCGEVGAFVILVGMALICILLLFETNLWRVWWALRWCGRAWHIAGRWILYGFAFIGLHVRNTAMIVARLVLSVPAMSRRTPKPQTASIIIVGADTPKKPRRRSRKGGDDDLALPLAQTLPVQDDEQPADELEPVPEEESDAEHVRETAQPAASVPRKVVPIELPVQASGEEKPDEPPELLPPYQKPFPDLLDDPPVEDAEELKIEVEQAVLKLDETFKQFGIEAAVGKAICGPVITCYEVRPAAGTKVNRITSLEHDLALAMKAKSIRIVAPIPGSDAVGIELPNAKRRMVTFSHLVHAPEFDKAEKKMTIPLALGQMLNGTTFIDDLAEMPHLLVAGATGSGKSVCINTILLSLLFRFEPHELKLVLVDPKHVELVPYKDLPHLLVPVLNDVTKVPDALDWLIVEMDKRYKYFSRLGVRNLAGFNAKRVSEPQPLKVMLNSVEHDLPAHLPYIVVVIDELADLMMVVGDEVEKKIIRLAQLARAAGIHMVLATQRPSTNVITGLIKANVPARIAFRTSSRVDSQVIIDEPGSEKLLGKGDMLFRSPTSVGTMRIQGAYVSEEEVKRVTNLVRDQREPQYVELGLPKLGDGDTQLEMDDKFDDAVLAVLESGQASASFLQRRLQVGYARAARLVDLMEAQSIVGPKRGAKPRDILVEQWPPDTGQ